MNSVVYFPYLSSAPIGIWWLDEESATPALYSPDPDDPRVRAAQYVLTNKVPQVSWPDFWDQLSERDPSNGLWEPFELPDKSDPVKFLEKLIKASNR